MKMRSVTMAAWLAFSTGVAGCFGPEHKVTVDVGGGGVKTASTHWDTGDADWDYDLHTVTGLMRGPTPRGTAFAPQPAGHPVVVSALGHIGIGHEHGGASLVEYLGGIRLTNEEQFKYPIYGEFLMGWVHYNGFGESDFTIRPSAGIKFPLQNKKYRVFVQGGLPFVFFGFYHERGLEWRAGLEIPIEKKTP